MAKKKKNDNPELGNKTEIEVIENANYVQVVDGTPLETPSYITTTASSDIDICCTGVTISNIAYFSMNELLSYDEACRMICGHYDREMKLNELERKNYTKEQIIYNREKYSKFVNIHNRLREEIENKIEKLAENENW